jgi:2-iminobutanoate/2-iminopropanoate deaminase
MRQFRSCLILSLFAATGMVLAQSAEFKSPPDLNRPNGYTHVVVVNRGKLIFISGQVGLDRKGQMAGSGDFVSQAKQAFANLNSALAAAGAKASDLAKLNYFVVGLDGAKLSALRRARDAMIDKSRPPASTLVGVQSLFREDAQIEIEAEALVP